MYLLLIFLMVFGYKNAVYGHLVPVHIYYEEGDRVNFTFITRNYQYMAYDWWVSEGSLKHVFDGSPYGGMINENTRRENRYLVNFVYLNSTYTNQQFIMRSVVANNTGRIMFNSRNDNGRPRHEYYLHVYTTPICDDDNKCTTFIYLLRREACVFDKLNGTLYNDNRHCLGVYNKLTQYCV